MCIIFSSQILQDPPNQWDDKPLQAIFQRHVILFLNIPQHSTLHHVLLRFFLDLALEPSSWKFSWRTVPQYQCCDNWNVTSAEHLDHNAMLTVYKERPRPRTEGWAWDSEQEGGD